MVSVLPSQSLSDTQTRLNEVENLHEAVEPLTQLVLRSHNSSIHLHCTIPTWGHSSSSCFDLHDLHERRSSFLVFIHDLLQSLRSSGITASYSLTPSDSSLCLACALPPNLGPSETKTAVEVLLQSSKFGSNSQVFLADLKHGPCLIVC